MKFEMNKPPLEKIQPLAMRVVPRHQRLIHLPSGKVTFSAEGRSGIPTGFVVWRQQTRMEFGPPSSKVVRKKPPRNRHGTMQLCHNKIVRT